MEKYLTLNDIKAYQIAFELSNYVWDVVIEWDWFAKKTLGGQFVESTDSVSANIAEGFGRYFKKDKVNFFRYSKGSTLEATDWNNKAIKRKLLSEEQYNHINNELQKLPREINNLINFTNEKLKI
ncbi:MAG: four helix bundle protein [Bacteroidales bacterium]